MTEAEWLASTDPIAMLRLYVSDAMPWPAGTPAPIVSNRKLRLFAAACCRLTGVKSQIVDAYEQDGCPCDAFEEVLSDAAWATQWANRGRREPPLPGRADLLRDIFGNPFCPVTSDLSWLTSNVIDLAQGIYADHAFECMPILGDALEDAGCDNADILNHCRQPGEHVRGCFCLDLILNKS